MQQQTRSGREGCLLHQVEERSITPIRFQIDTEEGVSSTEVDASTAVPFVLYHVAGRGKHDGVTLDVTILSENLLQGYGGHLTTVHEDGIIVLSVKRVFSVRAVVRVVVDAPQHQTFWRGA